MNNDMYDDMALERAAKEQFGISFEIDSVIVRNADVGKAAKATVFLTKKKQLFCYVHGPAKLLMGDVKKIAARMGLKIELFLPPRGQPHFFDEVAVRKFREVFPGRSNPRDEDLIFYRTLAPYSPALMIVAEVKDGIIYCADTDAHGGWRPVVRFAYRRIRTS